VITKRAPECAICNRTQQLRPVRDRHICRTCCNEAQSRDCA
jgi:hypothetical protein